MKDAQVFYEATPNPQAMKFIITEAIGTESVNFTSPTEAMRSPLANKIFGFPWAAGVFIGPNFVTVTKQDWVDWQVLADPLAQLIQEHLQMGEAVMSPAPRIENISGEQESDPIIRRIREVLDNEIRPAVAMDGGDIIFDRYEDQRVYLYMQGSCAGCPSSTMTLKQGIEVRLKEAVPEIQEVISI